MARTIKEYDSPRDNISGYLGIFQQPGAANYGNSTIYCVTDYTHSSLLMIILSASAFSDAYKVASLSTYDSVYIVPVALDAIYISDILNLYNKLKPLKTKVEVIYPMRPRMKTTTVFESYLVREEHYMVPFTEIGTHRNPTIDFVLSNKEDRVFFDVVLNDTKQCLYFSQYCDREDKIRSLYEDPYISEIHTAFWQGVYGGWGWDQFSSKYPKCVSKMVYHSFRSIDELNFATQDGRARVGKVLWNEFI